MRKLLFYLIIGLCAPLFAEEKLYTTEDYHIDVFGQDESEPINTGFFFHDGKYVEPPYIVKRLGISVFVNDVMVHIPVSYPLSSIRPISGKLPGMPKNITKESVPDDIVKFITEAFDYYFPKYY